jgi:hypothetical protein
VSPQVLHLDFIALNDHTASSEHAPLIEGAAELLALDQVIDAGVIQADDHSDYNLAFYFLLPDFLALEPFGTDPLYSRFLQKDVAPVLRSFAGADLLLEHDLRPRAGPAACIALTAPDEIYDWEVREVLDAWAERQGAEARATGLAAGERQRYRGACLAFGGNTPVAEPISDRRFGTTLVRGHAKGLG